MPCKLIDSPSLNRHQVPWRHQRVDRRGLIMRMHAAKDITRVIYQTIIEQIKQFEECTYYLQ